jgi:hypothetical protein
MDWSEKGRTAGPSGAGKFPVRSWLKRFETRRGGRENDTNTQDCLPFFLHRLFVVLFVIRSDPPSPIPPCQRTKLDSRPAQYNSNLWMDKGPLSNSSSKDASISLISEHAGRRILYSAPSTSMMPSDVRTDRTTFEMPPLMMYGHGHL